MNYCTRCNQEKPRSEFSPNKHLTSGVQSHCKQCKNEYQNSRNKSLRAVAYVRSARLGDSLIFDFTLGTPAPAVTPSPLRARFLTLIEQGATSKEVFESFSDTELTYAEITAALTQDGLSFPTEA